MLKDPVLAPGEPGVEVHLDGPERLKIGDGVTKWSNLSYYLTAEDIAGSVDIEAVVDLVMAELELPDLVLYYENAKA